MYYKIPTFYKQGVETILFYIVELMLLDGAEPNISPNFASFKRPVALRRLVPDDKV